nr:ABC transporter substrate-binding protein [uncultured Rhodoferax sp.]
MPDLNPTPVRPPAHLSRRQWGQGLLAAGLLPCYLTSFAAGKQRVVSIGGALTEIIYALGAQDELVAVDTTSQFPAAALKLPNVGYARTLSSEGVLAVSPTHILATEDAGPPAVIRQLQATGITVDILPANHRFEGLLDRVRRVGTLTDKRSAATELAGQLSKQWKDVRTGIQGRTGAVPRVLFVLSHSPSQIMVGGNGSSAEAMLEYSGARNAAQGFEGFKPITAEAVIAAQPDVILFTDQGLASIGGIEGALKLPGIRQTLAGQKRRITSLEAAFMLNFGPRMPAAVAALAQQIHRTASA